MILSNVTNLLIKHEGLKLFPYLCPAGKLTIGVGRNIEDSGISEKEAFYLLNNDIKRCYKDLSIYFFTNQFDDFPEDVQSVLINMRFQLGHTGFKGFVRMIFALKDNDYKEAARQMQDSRWYHQTTPRAQELIKIMEEAQ